MGLPTMIAEMGFGQNPSVTSPTWTDISSKLMEFTIRRGRQRELNRTETGVMTWKLRNQDRAFDPAYAAGTYYPNIVPCAPGRLRATFNSITYNLFRGDVEEWPQLWDARANFVGVQLLDGFDALNVADATTNRSTELSGTRVGAILDAAEWPAGLRSVDAGQSNMLAKNYVAENALSALQEVAGSESGNFFIDVVGNATFHDRHRRWKSPYTTVQVQLSNDPTNPELVMSGCTVNFDRDRVINDVTITQSGGSSYVASDTTSKNKYRKRSYSATVLLSNVNEIQAQCDYLVQTYKDPLIRVDDILLEPQMDDALWPHALGREIGDKITVEVFPPGGGAAIVVDCVIEYIQHTYVPGRWTTLWKVSRADTAAYWSLGTSALGTDTRLGW